MELKIEKIVDHGTLDSERVLISVLAGTDLCKFIITDTTYVGDNRVSNKLRHMYWFLSKVVKMGDKIELYTKKGTDSNADIGNGNKRYFIYWGLGSTVWNNTGDAAVLISIKEWDFTIAKGTV